eukprot:CAMPEP_0174362224 /NCGR_PEP_ID=MMETSP0811_2-20130205/63310_1 /TAXON_ID=73025 ORGANISM="Eutreptiella gymnastica-like, Strain CCMP1594" /NCGR_SAMPLE_ID=MMETSP0811_2 /ASSEMBLY_ACC=CAM_ASM_000667 /LENGTH=137 /DNA_ID=CAMNT_0015499691 /DNA_START=557 /DNA_END=967 /DNA_ORIENTATION=-
MRLSKATIPISFQRYRSIARGLTVLGCLYTAPYYYYEGEEGVGERLPYSHLCAPAGERAWVSVREFRSRFEGEVCSPWAPSGRPRPPSCASTTSGSMDIHEIAAPLAFRRGGALCAVGVEEREGEPPPSALKRRPAL